jgi:hypothetical protein
MKRILIPSLALSLLISGVAVHAETSVQATTTLKARVEAKNDEIKNVRDNFKKEIKDKKDEVKATVMQKKEEVKDIRMEFRGDKAKAMAARTVRMLTATADRLTKIGDRIETRIAKTNAKGGNTLEAKADLDLARANLVTARAQIVTLSSINLTFATGTATTTIQANFAQAKAEAALVKTSLKSAQENMVKATRALKMSEDKEATTTATTTHE